MEELSTYILYAVYEIYAVTDRYKSKWYFGFVESEGANY